MKSYNKRLLLTFWVVSFISLSFEMSVNFIPEFKRNEIWSNEKNTAGAVAGRIVSIPAKAYREAFKAFISLGQCPLVREENGDIKKCSIEFTGSKVFIAKSAMTVDVSRVENSEDILLHVMGGVGTSVGVLGLVSVSPKVKVAVTTETSKKTLNLISSYEMNKGVLTLHNARPKEIVTDSALFLSEIELGGNEMMMVTLEFESERQKTDVQVTITFKILFISITAKLRYVNSTFKTKIRTRVQFKSSWRKELDETFSTLEAALPRVEEIEKMYMQGPNELKNMSNDDEKLHNIYHFSSWKQSPYGKKFNKALILHDLEFLMDQNTEMQSVLHRLSILRDKYWSVDQRNEMNKLNRTLTEKTQKLTHGLDKYHSLSPIERQILRDLYGQDRAPLYYSRELNSIIGE